MYDASTHLLLAHAEQRERIEQAARANRAARIVRLRRLDREVERASTRARLLRLAIG